MSEIYVVVYVWWVGGRDRLEHGDWSYSEDCSAKIMRVFCNDIPKHHRPKQMVSGMCIYAIIDIFALRIKWNFHQVYMKYSKSK